MEPAGSIDEALSMEIATMDAQAAEPRARRPLSAWHQRRMLGFGASDVPALLVAFGLRDGAKATKRCRDNAAIVRGSLGVPRIIAEKAGVKRPLAHSGGGEREGELVRAWATGLRPYDPFVASSLVHYDEPEETKATLVDPECPRLAVSLDARIRDLFGSLGVVEAKCGDVDTDDGVCPWAWRDQVQAQLAASGLSWGVAVQGVGWAYRDGPIRWWMVDRDDAAIAEIRGVVNRAWLMVEDVKRQASVIREGTRRRVAK
jgi:hypothetical protein